MDAFLNINGDNCRIYFNETVERFKVDTVASGIGMSKNELVDLLRSKGCKIRHHDQYLTEFQLEMVSKIYVNSFRQQFGKLKKRANLIGMWRLIFLPIMSFVRRNFLDPEDPTLWEFDDVKAEEHFYALLRSARKKERFVFGIYAAILRRMVRVVKVYVSNRTNLLHSIIPPKLFFTYSDEEDGAMAAFSNRGFAVAGNQ